MYRVQRKRKGWLFYTLLFLGTFVIGLGIGYGIIRIQAARQEKMIASMQAKSHAQSERAKEDRGVAAAVTTMVPAATETPKTGYFVAEKDGDVCVFYLEPDGSQRFSHKLPIVLGDLREEDRQLFKEGIYIDSKQALLELTEDFCS